MQSHIDLQFDYDLIFSNDQSKTSNPSTKNPQSTPRIEETRELPLFQLQQNNKFPKKGTEIHGGKSNGLYFETMFGSADMDKLYQMVIQFLHEQEYTHLFLPKNYEELSYFKYKTRNKQILLFEDNGYLHYPIKILFLPKSRKIIKLCLQIYNIDYSQSLLHFHRKV